MKSSKTLHGVLVILLLSISATAALQNPDWYNTTSDAYGLGAEKISGTLLQDIVVGCSIGSSCWFNNAQVFTQAFTLPPAGYDVQFGQLRGESPVKDLAIAYAGVTIYQNDNDGSLTQLQSFNEWCDQIAWGKVWLHSYDDLVGGTIATNYIYIYYNDGNGNLGNPVQVNVHEGSRLVRLANLYQTAIPHLNDLITVSSNGQYVRIFTNNAQGSFIVPPRQSLDLGINGGITDIAIGDVDQDGYNDLVLTKPNFIPTRLRVYHNLGNGMFDDVSFEEVPRIVTPLNIALIEADYDGYPDLAMSPAWGSGFNYLQVLANDHNGNFEDPSWSTIATIAQPSYMYPSRLIAASLTTNGANSLICAGLRDMPEPQANLYGFYVCKDQTDQPPIPPRHLTVQADPNENPYLSWTLNEEDDISSYKIWRALTLSPEIPLDGFEQIGEVNHPTNHFTDEDVFLHQPTFNYMIWYYVTAVDNNDNQSEPSDTINFRGLYHPQSNGPGLVISPSQHVAFSTNATPSPFNAITKISFVLPEISMINLTVYNVSGRQVAQLGNGLREAGQHQVTFDGSSLPSGLYLYHLTAGQNAATGKMVLLK